MAGNRRANAAGGTSNDDDLAAKINNPWLQEVAQMAGQDKALSPLRLSQEREPGRLRHREDFRLKPALPAGYRFPQPKRSVIGQ